MTVIGLCICIREPRGDHGLEGYSIGERYRFQRCENDKSYYRVYPNDETDYYETCSVGVFKKYFKLD